MTYPETHPIRINRHDIQFKCMQLSKVERERIYDQHGQGTLAWIPR
jgi:hypothetical protein